MAVVDGESTVFLLSVQTVSLGAQSVESIGRCNSLTTDPFSRPRSRSSLFFFHFFCLVLFFYSTLIRLCIYFRGVCFHRVWHRYSRTFDPFGGLESASFYSMVFFCFFLFFSFSASARSYRVFTEFSMCSKGLLAVLITVYSIRRRTYVSTRYSGQPSIKLIAGRSAA